MKRLAVVLVVLAGCAKHPDVVKEDADAGTLRFTLKVGPTTFHEEMPFQGFVTLIDARGSGAQDVEFELAADQTVTHELRWSGYADRYACARPPPMGSTTELWGGSGVLSASVNVSFTRRAETIYVAAVMGSFNPSDPFIGVAACPRQSSTANGSVGIDAFNFAGTQLNLVQATDAGTGLIFMQLELYIHHTLMDGGVTTPQDTVVPDPEFVRFTPRVKDTHFRLTTPTIGGWNSIEATGSGFENETAIELHQNAPGTFVDLNWRGYANIECLLQRGDGTFETVPFASPFTAKVQMMFGLLRNEVILEPLVQEFVFEREFSLCDVSSYVSGDTRVLNVRAFDFSATSVKFERQFKIYPGFFDMTVELEIHH